MLDYVMYVMSGVKDERINKGVEEKNREWA